MTHFVTHLSIKRAKCVTADTLHVPDALDARAVLDARDPRGALHACDPREALDAVDALDALRDALDELEHQ